MKRTETTLPGVFILEPRVFADERGFFMESYNQSRFAELGIPLPFVQDNHSRSKKNVVRGLHYQLPDAQGKLVRCIGGALFDVAVDIRRGSPSFGKWFGLELSDENRRMLWVPPGFAHGFCALTDFADLSYKCTSLYDAAGDHSLLWNDPQIGIEWPVQPGEALLSPKDAAAPSLSAAPLLPTLAEFESY